MNSAANKRWVGLRSAGRWALPIVVESRVAMVLLTVCLVMQCGCQQEPQKPAIATYPVKGKVVTRGNLPVGGCVQFQPTEHGADYVANGIINEQGGFSLQVPFVDRVLRGATEGPHTVRVLLPLNQGGAPVPISGTFVVKATENEFTIEMPSTPAG